MSLEGRAPCPISVLSFSLLDEPWFSGALDLS
jgi:hypothetical protein